MGLFRGRAKSRNYSDLEQPKVGELLEAAPDGIVIINADGKIVVINSQTELLFGYTRAELVGQPVEILVPARFEQVHASHRGSFIAAARVRPMGAGLTLFGKRKNGAEFPVEISLSPLRTSQGVFIISAVRDVTDRKHAEEQIKQLNAELGAALRRAEQLGPGGELAVNMARQIEAILDRLYRLFSQMERGSVAQPPILQLIANAREEVEQISHITAEVIALQQEHEDWKKA